MASAAPDSLKQVLLSLGFTDDQNASLSNLAQEMEILNFNPGDVLMREGDPGDSLYLVLYGTVDVNAQNRFLARLGSGEMIGELSLLTGEPRSATVSAIEPVRVARLSRGRFEGWAESLPDAARQLSAIMLERLYKVRLAFALHRNELFAALEPAVLRDLESELKLVTLASGQVLYHEGDPGDTLAVVVDGRLRVSAANLQGEEYQAEVGRGETVGEMALVTGQLRSATVTAIRDSNVALLCRAAYERLLAKYPLAISQIVTGSLVTKLQNMSEGLPRRPVLSTIALIPADRNVPLDPFTVQLTAGFARIGKTLLLSSTSVERLLGKEGAAQLKVDHGGHVTLVEWLQKQELEHDYVIYQLDPDPSEWSRRCIRQADRVLIVGDASGSGARSELERLVLPEQRPRLALLQKSTEPSGTAAWIANRQLEGHHHVRLDHPADYDRLVRFLTGRAVGLTLGGGFARGLAHLGVIRAMRELGIPIDAIGGASMGSIVGAMWDQGWSEDRILAETRAGCENLFNDLTLPFIAFKTGKKFAGFISSVFGERRIEDLFLPYFCVSANLNRAEAAVHRLGSLAKAVLASARGPVIFPPVVYDGELHVDGGVLNNVPVDVMKSFVNGGIVIGVDASPPHELSLVEDYGSHVDGWKVVKSYISPFARKRAQVPHLMLVLLRTIECGGLLHKQTIVRFADLYLRPPLLQFMRSDFHAAAEIAQIGYDYASKEIQAWLRTGTGRAVQDLSSAVHR